MSNLIFQIKVEIEKKTQADVNQDYIWIGKSEDWVVQKMHENSFNVLI